MLSSTEKQKDAEKTEPLVFVNQPITSSGDDIIGFSTQVDTICAAIKDGSSMIGLIADYGSGKSSLTELLCEKVKKSPYRYPNPIIINMWDSINEKSDTIANETVTQHEVSRLTKSFLYQLSKGRGRLGFSSYINRRLSKNHGNFSFSVGSRKFWICFIFAAILYGIYLVGKNINSNLVAALKDSGTLSFSFFQTGQVTLLELLAQIHPTFLVLAMLFLIWGVANTCVVFSHWKNQEARETEMNDVFDLYIQIIKHIKPGKGKKQIIVVEDLDRIEDKSIVIGFMKELYRFQNSAQKDSDKFVFVVAVKPEDSLAEKRIKNGGTKNGTELQIYPKLFDITVPLKPIHFDDYRAVLLQLIKRDAGKKVRLEKIIQKEIDSDILPEEFNWLVTGENLSVRDLKDRLNHAIMIMTSRKEYKTTTAVTFKGCAAVTYLESRYPKDYLKLIQDEQGFAKLMSKSVDILNQNQNEEKAIGALKDSFSSLLGKEHTYNPDMVQDLCHMIWDGTFNYDFRMYFYTYPAGSHVKTTEESKLCNMLLMPAKNRDLNELDTIVEAAYQNGENNIVTSTIQSLDNYPRVVLLNSTLLKVAGTSDWEKLSDLAIAHYVENIAGDDDATAFWKRVYDVRFPMKEQFLLHMVDHIKSIPNGDRILNIRTQILLALGGGIRDIAHYEELFVNGQSTYVPMITHDEINIIDNAEISIPLINQALLSLDNYDSIARSLCAQKLSSNTLTIAQKIMRSCLKIQPEGLGDIILTFLNLNHLVDDDLFPSCIAECGKEEIVDYISSIAIEELTDKYYKYIDTPGIGDKLSTDILDELAERKLYKCILVQAADDGDYHLLDQVRDDFDSVGKNCEWLQSTYPDAFVKIRYYLCVEIEDNNYFSLYDKSSSIISEREYSSFKNTTSAIRCINTRLLTKDNKDHLLSIIISRKYTPDEGLLLVRQLFDTDYNPYAIFSDKALYVSIACDLDYRHLHIHDLGMEGREKVYTLVKTAFDSLGLRLDEQMRKMNCLVESAEKILSDEKNDIDRYYGLINELGDLTDFGISFLETHYLTVGLSHDLADKLLKNEDFKNYVIATALREKNLILDDSIPFQTYFDIYCGCSSDEMYNLMSGHWNFLETIQEAKYLDALFDLKNYSKFIEPLYKVPQHIGLFKWIMDSKIDSKEKEKYLDSIHKYASENDSLQIQRIICKEENMELMGNSKRYWHIRELFWKPEHKSSFTRAWNKRWATRIGEAS